MPIKIGKQALLKAIQKLETKKLMGIAQNLILTGNVVISHADKTAMLQLDKAKVTVPTDGVKDCLVCIPFQIFIALLKSPKKARSFTLNMLKEA